LLELNAMETKKRELTSWMNIDSWVRRYQMREKVRCHPDQYETLHSPEETNALFYAYVGGVFVNLGMDVVQEWINALIGLEGTQRPPPSHRKVKNLPTPQLPPVQPPPPPRPQFIPPQPGLFAQFSRFPAPMPLFSPAPMAKPSPPPKLPNPMTPAQPHLAFFASVQRKGLSTSRGGRVSCSVQRSSSCWKVDCQVCCQRDREGTRRWWEQADCKGTGSTGGILRHGMDLMICQDDYHRFCRAARMLTVSIMSSRFEPYPHRRWRWYRMISTVCHHRN